MFYKNDNKINKDNIYKKSFFEVKYEIEVTYARVVSAFKTESNEIIIFYIDKNNKLT